MASSDYRTSRETRGNEAKTAHKEDSKRVTREDLKRRFTDYKGPLKGVVSVPGFKCRWFNDNDKGRISSALTLGYRFIKKSDNMIDNSGLSVNPGEYISKPVGNGLTAYLMGIPEEEYKLLKSISQEDADAHEASVKRNLDKRGYFKTTASTDQLD